MGGVSANIWSIIGVLGAAVLGLAVVFVEYSTLIIGAATIFTSLFLVVEWRKKGIILTLGNIFTGYWFLYTTSFWINYKLGMHQLADMHYFYVHAILSLVGFLSFQIVYYPGKYNGDRRYGLDLKYYNITLLVIALVFIFSIACGLAIWFFMRVGLSNFIFMSRQSRMLLLQDAGVTSFLPLFSLVMIVSLVLIEQYPSKVLSFLLVTSFAFRVFYSLVVVGRGNLLSTLIPVVYILLLSGRIKTRSVIIWGCVMFVFLTYFKTIMTNVIFGRNVSLGRFQLSGEFEAWYHVSRTVLSGLDKGSLSHMYGKSYLEALYNLVVPFTSVEPLSVWYVRTYLYETYLRGGGAAFSSIAEAVMNFGYLGVPLYFAFLGYICRRLEQLRMKDLRYFVIYVYALTVVYQFFRSEFYSLTKSSWWFFVLPVFFLLSVTRLAGKRSYNMRRERA